MNQILVDIEFIILRVFICFGINAHLICLYTELSFRSWLRFINLRPINRVD